VAYIFEVAGWTLEDDLILKQCSSSSLQWLFQRLLE